MLTTVSTCQVGEVSVKIFNAGKEAKIISQILAMVGIHMFDGCKVTWDTQVTESKPLKVEKGEEANQIAIEVLKKEYPKVFEDKIHHGRNKPMQIAKVCHHEINWKVNMDDIPLANYGENYNIEQVPQNEINSYVRTLKTQGIVRETQFGERFSFSLVMFPRKGRQDRD